MIYYTTAHAFAAALQGVVAEGLGMALPSPSNATTTGRSATLSLLHLHFICRVVGVAYLPPLWEEADRVKRRTEGIANLNQALLRGLPSFWRVLGVGRT